MNTLHFKTHDPVPRCQKFNSIINTRCFSILIDHISSELFFKYTPSLVDLLIEYNISQRRIPKITPRIPRYSYRKLRRPKRSWLGSLSYAVFIRGGRSVPPSIKPLDSGGRWQSDAGRRCERICRGPPHFRLTAHKRLEQPRGSSNLDRRSVPANNRERARSWKYSR